jgi:hypothetical protein
MLMVFCTNVCVVNALVLFRMADSTERLRMREEDRGRGVVDTRRRVHPIEYTVHSMTPDERKNLDASISSVLTKAYSVEVALDGVRGAASGQPAQCVVSMPEAEPFLLIEFAKPEYVDRVTLWGVSNRGESGGHITHRDIAEADVLLRKHYEDPLDRRGGEEWVWCGRVQEEWSRRGQSKPNDNQHVFPVQCDGDQVNGHVPLTSAISIQITPSSSSSQLKTLSVCEVEIFVRRGIADATSLDQQQMEREEQDRIDALGQMLPEIPHSTALFGPQTYGVSGDLVHMIPELGCAEEPTIKKKYHEPKDQLRGHPSTTPEDVRGKIAGKCVLCVRVYVSMYGYLLHQHVYVLAQ